MVADAISKALQSETVKRLRLAADETHAMLVGVKLQVFRVRPTIGEHRHLASFRPGAPAPVFGS